MYINCMFILDLIVFEKGIPKSLSLYLAYNAKKTRDGLGSVWLLLIGRHPVNLFAKV